MVTVEMSKVMEFAEVRVIAWAKGRPRPLTTPPDFVDGLQAAQERLRTRVVVERLQAPANRRKVNKHG